MKCMVQIRHAKLTQKGLFNHFRVTGSNINGSLGIGSQEESSLRVHTLHELNYKRLYQVAVGDFHTLALASGCTCLTVKGGTCKGLEACGADLYAWGFNMHGQVDGRPSQEPVLRPRIVPFFVGKKKVTHLSACRSRSIAVTSDNQVFEWGFTGSDGEQFQQLHQLEEPVKEVRIGLEFNLFLGQSGTLWYSGAITQEGENVVDTYGGLINLTNRMPVAIKFKRIDCGYSHALLVDEDDRLYAFGAGLYG